MLINRWQSERFSVKDSLPCWGTTGHNVMLKVWGQSEKMDLWYTEKIESAIQLKVEKLDVIWLKWLHGYISVIENIIVPIWIMFPLMIQIFSPPRRGQSSFQNGWFQYYLIRSVYLWKVKFLCNVYLKIIKGLKIESAINYCVFTQLTTATDNYLYQLIHDLRMSLESVAY